MTTTPGDLGDAYSVILRDPTTTAHIVHRSDYWQADRGGYVLTTLCGHREYEAPGLDDRQWNAIFGHHVDTWRTAPVCFACVCYVVAAPEVLMPRASEGQR